MRTRSSEDRPAIVFEDVFELIVLEARCSQRVA